MNTPDNDIVVGSSPEKNLIFSNKFKDFQKI